MNYELPYDYNWFIKLKLTRFIPWHFESDLDELETINDRFRIEVGNNREVKTFARRQDMDTFAGFEFNKGKVSNKVIVFHPSFQSNVKGWNIIYSEHLDFFDFMEKTVLPEMKSWIVDDDVNYYIA